MNKYQVFFQGILLGGSNIVNLNNYNLKPIGSGTFGRVYQMTNINNPKDQKAAKLIELTSKNVNNIDEEIRFLQLLTGTNDPRSLNLTTFYENIVIDFNHFKHIEVFRNIPDTSEKYMFLIMMLCRGGELFDYVISNRSLNENEARIIMWQLFQGISYIHEKGVIHRDLKLENILLVKPNEITDVRIADFGLSYDIGNCRTKNGSVKSMAGSLTYTAPEVLQGAGYGCKCDLWSLGVILFILVTGHPPFDISDGMTTTSIVNVLKHSNWKQFESYRKLSKNIKKLLDNLIVFDPKYRYDGKTALQSSWFRGFDPSIIQKPKLDVIDRKPIIEVEPKQTPEEYLDSNYESDIEDSKSAEEWFCTIS